MTNLSICLFVFIPKWACSFPFLIGLYSESFDNSEAKYNKLGQFEYGADGEGKTEIRRWKGVRGYGFDAIYFGEIKEGTEKFNGVGIWVYGTGRTMQLDKELVAIGLYWWRVLEKWKNGRNWKNYRHYIELLY